MQVQNRKGEFVRGHAEGIKAAAAGADWSKAPGFFLIHIDQPGTGAWPISGATFILMHKVQTKPRAKEALNFFDWAYSDEGDKLAAKLAYVTLPNPVIQQIHAAWKTQIKDADGKPVWP